MSNSAAALTGDFAMALDRCLFARAVGIEPDQRQSELLDSTASRILMLCSRQWGKSTIAAVLAAHELIYCRGSTVIAVSPSLSQSQELFKKVNAFWKLVPGAPEAVQESLTRMELANGSRLIALPGTEKTIRGISAVSLILVDEAAAVDDTLLAAVRPMMATRADARFIAMTTPRGRRGWLYEAWERGEGWERISVKADECARISPEFLAEEMRTHGPLIFSQEYQCAFVDSGDNAFNSALIEAAMSMEFEPFFPRANSCDTTLAAI
jgi:Helicase